MKSLREARRDFDARYTRRALRETDGNLVAAAQRLKINRPSLYRILKRCGIERPSRAPRAPKTTRRDPSVEAFTALPAVGSLKQRELSV